MGLLYTDLVANNQTVTSPSAVNHGLIFCQKKKQDQEGGGRVTPQYKPPRARLQLKTWRG